MSKFTTIRIKKGDKKKLDEMGTKADTHADIVGRLIQDFEKNNKKQKRIKRE